MRVEKSNVTVVRMARLLEVSRSGFYAWLKREPSDRAVRKERIAQKVAWFHGESDEVSGSPKILADLRDDGEVISRKTVAKVMRRLGLRGICPRRWRTTTIIDGADAYPVDAVKREWDTVLPDHHELAWTTPENPPNHRRHDQLNNHHHRTERALRPLVSPNRGG